MWNQDEDEEEMLRELEEEGRKAMSDTGEGNVVRIAGHKAGKPMDSLTALMVAMRAAMNRGDGSVNLHLERDFAAEICDELEALSASNPDPAG